MKRSKVLLGAVALAFTVTACDGLKDAFTAHVDQVARAAGQELSSDRLAKLVGNSQIPVRKDVMGVVADFWVSYQLLGYAGAHNDSLNDPKLVETAMWASIVTSRAQRYYETVRKKFTPVDTTGLDAKYAQGNLMAAQHILIMMPESGKGMSPAKQDSIRKKAEDIRRKVTSANFDAMVKQYTEEPGGKDRKGALGVFPAGPGPGSMVPEFEAGVRALKPGEVSATLTQSSFGFHIIRRNLLSEVRPQFIEKLGETNEGTQRDAAIAKFRADWKVDVKKDSASVAKIRSVAQGVEAAKDDHTVLATSRAGDFTAARLAQWIEAIPPQAQIRERIANMPDSSVVSLVRSLLDQEIINAQAIKEGVNPDSNEVAQYRGAFAGMVKRASEGLRVDPKSLSDSAKSTGEKEKLAATRVEAALDRLFATNGQNFVEVPTQLAAALRSKYSSRVNPAGVDRALQGAGTIRAAADSARAKQGAMPPEGAQPPAVQPPPAAPPAKAAPPGKQPPPVKK